MIFFITTLFLIAYGINLVIATSTVIASNDPKSRRYAVLTIFISLLAGAGVIYLAAH